LIGANPILLTAEVCLVDAIVQEDTLTRQISPPNVTHSAAAPPRHILHPTPVAFLREPPPTIAGIDAPGIGFEFQNTTPCPSRLPSPATGPPTTGGSTPPGIGFEFQNSTPCPSRLHRPPPGHPPPGGIDSPRNWLRISKHHALPKPAPIARHRATHHCGDRLPPELASNFKTPRPAQAGSHRPPRGHPPLRGSAPPGIGFEFQNTTPAQAGPHRPSRRHTPLRGSTPPGIGFEFSKQHALPKPTPSPATGPPTTAWIDSPRNWLRIFKTARPAQAGSHRPPPGHPPLGGSAPPGIGFEFSKQHALPKPARPSRRYPPLRGSTPPQPVADAAKTRLLACAAQ
jgi:hypothetical protein